MGKSGRDWTQMYTIYGMDEWTTPAFLTLHAVLFSLLSTLLLAYFDAACLLLHSLSPHRIPTAAARSAAGFVGSVIALSALCLFYAAGNMWYSGLVLRWEMGLRMVGEVGEWEGVRHVLDVGCGRGMLLNAVAMRMKKEGSEGRVVGLVCRRKTAMTTLRTAALEGVQEYVTCREGDARRLPFSDNYFDAVVSALFLHTAGKEYGPRTAEAAAERNRVLGELVRVLKPGRVGVVWDLLHVPEYVQRLRELNMEDIKVSERVTAFMVSSYIVSFRKPSHHCLGSGEIRLDWRFNGIF